MFLGGYFAVTQGQWGMLLGKGEEWDCHAPLSHKPVRTETLVCCHVGDPERVSGCFLKARAINIVFLSSQCCPAYDIHYDGSAGSLGLIDVLVVF